MQKNGFSLLELSIVLVIIGLIAGGIVAGAAMIRAAEIRSTITEFQRYQTSINVFKDKYLALPGDMKNATAFWGIAAGTAGNDATCFAQDSTDGTTCDGNGDGQIDFTDWAVNQEYQRAWQHLSNAGLVEGVFTGVTSGTNGRDPGVNMPDSAISSGAAWGLRHWNPTAGTYGNTGFLLSLGDVDTTPEETWSIDKKLDDGKPASGRATVSDSTWSAGCTTSDTASLAEYNLSSDNPDCSGIFFWLN